MHAASWTRVLSCKDIAAELGHGAELLQSVDASRPARHASIEIVFEQSWRLLSERERTALARLAVFRGGFSPDAARAVGGVALPVLAALVDKSLLRKEGNRCFFHPLVHQFAHAKLEEALEAQDRAAAHGRHFLCHLSESSDRASHADSDTLRELDAEFENIRTAWHFAVTHGPTDDLSRAAYGLMCYCDYRGRPLDGLELLQEALASEEVARDPKAVSALAAPAAWLALRLDRYAEAEALGIRTLNAGESGGIRRDNATSVYRAATILGATCSRLGRADDARGWFERALEVAEKSGDPTDVASALDNLGLAARGRGDLDAALRLYGQALLKHREVGDAGGEAVCLNNQAVVHILRGELDAAQKALRDARLLCERHGLPSTRSMIEVNSATVSIKLGAPEQALAHARKALEVSAQTGQRSTAIEARYAIVMAALRQGDLATTRRELATAVESSIAIGRPELIVHGVWHFAELVAAQGEREVAARVLAYALQHPGLVGAERDEAEQQLRSWSASAATPSAWTGPSMDELGHRIVTEAGVAHAPLIAMLASAGRRASATTA